MKNRSKKEITDSIDDINSAVNALRGRLSILDKELDKMSELTGTIRTAVSHMPLALVNDIEVIAVEVAEAFGVPEGMLFTASRREPVRYARFCIWAILRNRGYTYHEIGAAFKRHHAAIIHGVKRVDDLPYLGKRVLNSLEQLEEKGYTLIMK